MSYSQPALDFTKARELVLNLLKPLDFLDVVRVSGVNHNLREAGIFVITQRLDKILLRWFTKPQIRQFMNMLETSNSVIGGFVPLLLMDVPINDDAPANDWGVGKLTDTLTLLTRGPAFNYTCWPEWLEQFGYRTDDWEGTLQLTQPIPLQVVHMTYSKPKTYVKICVEVSWTRDVMDAVLNGKPTILMNFISSSTIYSFYPALTRRMIAVGGLDRDPWIEHRFFDLGVKFVNDMSEVHEPCQLACPAMWRRIRGLPYVGQFQFDPAIGEYGDGAIKANKPRIWTLGNRCHNNYCRNLFHRSKGMDGA